MTAKYQMASVKALVQADIPVHALSVAHKLLKKKKKKKNKKKITIQIFDSHLS